MANTFKTFLLVAFKVLKKSHISLKLKTLVSFASFQIIPRIFWSFSLFSLFSDIQSLNFGSFVRHFQRQNNPSKNLIFSFLVIQVFSVVVFIYIKRVQNFFVQILRRILNFPRNVILQLNKNEELVTRNTTHVNLLRAILGALENTLLNHKNLR